MATIFFPWVMKLDIEMMVESKIANLLDGGDGRKLRHSAESFTHISLCLQHKIIDHIVE